MKTVSVSCRISAPAQAVWEIVRTGADMNRWVPAITACRLEGAGVGAKRVCTVNGQELREAIETLDETSRLFQYRIDRQVLMPIRNILGTISPLPRSALHERESSRLEPRDPARLEAARGLRGR
jgi:hypothetical protein